MKIFPRHPLQKQMFEKILENFPHMLLLENPFVFSFKVFIYFINFILNLCFYPFFYLYENFNHF